MQFVAQLSEVDETRCFWLRFLMEDFASYLALYSRFLSWSSKTASTDPHHSPNINKVCPHILLLCHPPLERLLPALTAHSGQVLAAANRHPVHCLNPHQMSSCHAFGEPFRWASGGRFSPFLECDWKCPKYRTKPRHDFNSSYYYFQ